MTFNGILGYLVANKIGKLVDKKGCYYFSPVKEDHDKAMSFFGGSVARLKQGWEINIEFTEKDYDYHFECYRNCKKFFKVGEIENRAAALEWMRKNFGVRK